MKGIEFQIDDVAKRNPKAKGAKAEVFVNLALLKELDQSGFIDRLYKSNVLRPSRDCPRVRKSRTSISRLPAD